MKEAELYYSGTIVEIIDEVLYEIKVDIPGVKTGVTAYPMRGEVDEPRIGDFVLLKCLDPVFQSYYLYQKIKENDFIGFRSNGKMVDITPDYIQVAIFDPSNKEWNDNNNYRPEPSDWIRLDKDGNLNIHLRSNSSITIEGDVSNNYESNMSLTVNGNADINIKGSTVLKSPDITIKGPGTLTCEGTVVPSAEGGPFCAVKVAPPPGTAMISGNVIMLK